MLHHVTERYRLLVTGSGCDCRCAPARSQRLSTIERSTLRARAWGHGQRHLRPSLGLSDAGSMSVPGFLLMPRGSCETVRISSVN